MALDQQGSQDQQWSGRKARSDPRMDSDDYVDRLIAPELPPVNSLDPKQVLLSFDKRSDTLMVYFFGRGRDLVGIESGNHTFKLVDQESEEIAGLRVEGFLSHVVPSAPFLLGLLNDAELRGITANEVRDLRRQYIRWWRRAVELVFSQHTSNLQHRQQMVEQMEQLVYA